MADFSLEHTFSDIVTGREKEEHTGSCTNNKQRDLRTLDGTAEKEMRHARYSGDGHGALQYLLIDMAYYLSYRTMAITTLYTDPPGKLHLSKESQIPVAHHWQRSLDLGLDKTNSGLVQSIRALEHFRTNIGDLLFPPDDAV